MTGRLKWYYSRLSTMNFRELFFRAGQMQQRAVEKLFTPEPTYRHVTVNAPSLHFSFPSTEFNNRYTIFDSTIEINDRIDFHQDISSGKCFPMTFSKSIDIRTDRYGSAKMVWEVNRLQFLLPLLVSYKSTGDRAKLDLFVSIMTNWQQQNPYLKGINWYSNIEVNLRLINWYWCWILLENDENWMNDKQYEAFRAEVWLPMIYSHCVYSDRNPSFHSSANNHLIAEYAGLFVASSIWKFPETEQWQQKSRKGLEREIIKQHSENGINREEAAGYIQFITDLFLVAYVASEQTGLPFSTGFTQRLKDICSYINNLLDIRGNWPKYGDEDDGRVVIPGGELNENNFLSILNTTSVLFNKPEWKRKGAEWDVKSEMLTTHINGREKWKGYDVHQAPPVSAFFPKEGHFIMRKYTTDNTEVYCHFDAAPLGYLSIAAHGHADALSFILHIDGFPFIVDPGTFAYHTHREWRNYFVSTLAHNTVTIDMMDQAQLSGPTLWLDHYRCTVNEASSSDTHDHISATHNGYKKIKTTHTREMDFDKEKDYFRITDHVTTGKDSHSLTMPFHLHPAVQVFQRGNSYILSRKETASTIELTLDTQLSCEAISATEDSPVAWYSPSFMKLEKSTVILGRCRTTNQDLTLTTYIKIINRP